MSEIDKQAGYVDKVPDEYAIELNFCTQRIERAQAELATANKSLELEKQRQQFQLMRMYAKLKLDPDDHMILPTEEGMIIICKNPKPVDPPSPPKEPDQPAEQKPADQPTPIDEGTAVN